MLDSSGGGLPGWRLYLLICLLIALVPVSIWWFFALFVWPQPEPANRPPDSVQLPPENYFPHKYPLLNTDFIGRTNELKLLTKWIAPKWISWCVRAPQGVSAASQSSISLPEASCRHANVAARVFVIHAIGGTGKSALTWTWLNDSAPPPAKWSTLWLKSIPWRKVQSIALGHLAGRMWWSFYEKDGGFDEFLTRAVAYVCDLGISEARDLKVDRAERLHRELRKRPFLLLGAPTVSKPTSVVGSGNYMDAANMAAHALDGLMTTR